MADLELGNRIAPDVPPPAETGSTRAPVDAARTGELSEAIELATDELLDAVSGLDDDSVHEASLLPGWTRAHVISHLARNADGYVNLLTWARTGVEHAMYASADDRQADIEEGGLRGHRLLFEDLAASAGRFGEAVRTMPSNAWKAEVVDFSGRPMPALDVLRGRLLEVWVHLVDLDLDFDFEDIPQGDIETLLNDAVRGFSGRADVPAVRIDTVFDDGRGSVWQLGGPAAHSRVHGRPGALLGWLLGRHGVERLSGDPPELPRWR